MTSLSDAFLVYEDMSAKEIATMCRIQSEVKASIKELKKIGLKKTLYPKYLMITKDDLDKIFGKELCK